MTDDQNQEQQKIIIDEGWKSQVQKEKEAARKAREEADAANPAQDEPAAEAPPEEQGGEPLSPFLALVQSIATQTLFALGIIAPQGAEQVMVDIQGAKITIDMLLALHEKTEGNLTDDEKGHLTETIAELQRVYVVRAQQAQEAALKNAGIDPTNLKGGE